MRNIILAAASLLAAGVIGAFLATTVPHRTKGQGNKPVALNYSPRFIGGGYYELVAVDDSLRHVTCYSFTQSNRTSCVKW